MSLLSLTKKILRRDREEKGVGSAEKKEPPARKKRTQKDADKAAFRAVGDTKKVGKHTARESIIAGELGMTTLVSEKAVGRQGDNIKVFRVRSDATKGKIASAVKEKFGTDVVHVRVANFKAKARRRGYTVGKTTRWKKAYVKVVDSKSVQ